MIYPVDGGKPIQLRNVLKGEMPAQWTADGKSLLVGSPETPTRVFMIDLATGRRTLFRMFSLADPTGLFDSFPPYFSRDLKSFVYSYTRILSDLYIVDGLK